MCGRRYKSLPEPVLSNCTDPLLAGVPDMRGNWEGIRDNKTHWERIEQCSDRFVLSSSCVVHDFAHADGSVSHGVHDFSVVGCAPLIVAAVYNASCLTLKPFGEFTAVTRCLRADGSLDLDWNGRVDLLRRTNNTHGVEACDSQ